MERNRYCIYTVLVGDNYDLLKDPLKVNREFDYICFVGKGSHLINRSGSVWNMVEIPISFNDNVRDSRYPKILPHETLISRYDFSLYIDANVQIADDFVYNRFFELVENNVTISFIKHPWRDCVYQEAYVCIAAQKAPWIGIIRQVFFLKRKKVPKHGGLYEANVIFRKHNESDIVRMCDLWWNTFVNYSKRDQLSLAYALMDFRTPIQLFLPQGYSTHNHFAFNFTLHPPKTLNFEAKIKNKIVKIVYKASKFLLKEETTDFNFLDDDCYTSRDI